MNIDARIRRRQRARSDRRLIVNYDRLSPLTHVQEPIGRGPLIEQLLDHFEPTFRGELPPNGYLKGPKGSGKSAVVSVLLDRLAALSLQPGSVIHTATRARSPTTPQFVYVDCRRADSRFGLYRSLLDGLVDESVPEQGVGTAWMLEHLRDALSESASGTIAAVDHVGDAGATDNDWLVDAFYKFSDISWLLVSRHSPEAEIPVEEDAMFEIEAYQDRMLFDILMDRATVGLSGDALAPDSARTIGEWAEGDAHDALAALLSAADAAAESGNTHLRASDITAGIESVPRPCVSLGVLFALPANRQAVLRALADLDAEDRLSVTTAANAIATHDSVSLSSGTVTRFLYQLAEIGVVERIPREDTSGKGRPPSRVEARFPIQAFKRLYDTR